MSQKETPTSGQLVPTEDQELSADELSPGELAVREGQALPEREAMSSLNLNISGVENFAMPINEASALNYNSPYSVAVADADQTVILGQAAGDTTDAVGGATEDSAGAATETSGGGESSGSGEGA